MPHMEEIIKENLKAIEQEMNVNILYAAESGSRAWGVASPDSDYDVRFVYVRNIEEYLRLDPLRDVIEWCLDEVLDINGWDLKKALLGVKKSNPNLLEWVNSPIVYKQHAAWPAIRDQALAYASEKSLVCHYYGVAFSTYMEHLRGDKVRYKKYIYALRPLLCCLYVEHFHKPPVVEFHQLLMSLQEILPDDLIEAINSMLAIKVQHGEHDVLPSIPILQNFIAQECQRQKTMSEQLPVDHKRDYEPLNEVFLKLVKGQM